MSSTDAQGGGLARLLKLGDSLPPFRADVTQFDISLRLYPEMQNSPLISAVLKRPPVGLEESRETLLAVTVADKGRTKDGGQRQQLSLDDDPANARMFHAVCERFHCSLKRGEEPRDFDPKEELEGFDRQAGRTVKKAAVLWLPGYIKNDFIYHMLESRFRLVDAEGNFLDESGKGAREIYFALMELRQFYVLQEIGSLQRTDGTWTPPRNRALYTINEPTDKQRTRFKQSGFYMEQILHERQRSEQRSVKLRIMMALFDQMCETVYGMVVSDGTPTGVRPLDVTKPADRQYIFGTWQKNVLVPIFNNLMGVWGK
jgi:hypothetical protein